MILFGTYDQEWWFRDAVSGFAERTDLDSVGGLYPVIKVCGNDFLTLPQSVKTYKRGSSEIEADVTLDCERNVWWQRNHLTGKSIKLELPWSILPDARTNILFDDIDKRRR